MSSTGLRLVPKGKKTPSRGVLRDRIDSEILSAVTRAKQPLQDRIAKLERLRSAVGAYDAWLSGEGEVSLELQKKLWADVLEALRGSK